MNFFSKLALAYRYNWENSAVWSNLWELIVSVKDLAVTLFFEILCLVIVPFTMVYYIIVRFIISPFRFALLADEKQVKDAKEWRAKKNGTFEEADFGNF
jgi:hypothetical protein